MNKNKMMSVNILIDIEKEISYQIPDDMLYVVLENKEYILVKNKSDIKKPIFFVKYSNLKRREFLLGDLEDLLNFIVNNKNKLIIIKNINKNYGYSLYNIAVKRLNELGYTKKYKHI